MAQQDVEDPWDLKVSPVILVLKVTLVLRVLLVKQDLQVGRATRVLLDALRT